jgi:DNA-binding response OmpR family regulator
VIVDPALPDVGGAEFILRLKGEIEEDGTQVLLFSSREYSASELATLRVSPAHAFVKSRDHERELVLRLRAVLTVRQETPRVRRA